MTERLSVTSIQVSFNLETEAGKKDFMFYKNACLTQEQVFVAGWVCYIPRIDRQMVGVDEIGTVLLIPINRLYRKGA